MKPLEDRENFIKLRAEGKSYRQIAKELGIATETCRQWEIEYKDRIVKLKTDRLEELSNSYFMTKETRIQTLGESLKEINKALENVDLSTVAPEKLLDYKLKYVEALKNDFIDTTQETLKEDFTAKDILNYIKNLLTGLNAGAITSKQASKQCMIINQLLKAYENTELADKIKMLEGIMGSK